MYENIFAAISKTRKVYISEENTFFMRSEIEFYYKPEKPMPLSSLAAKVTENDFSQLFTDNDRNIIERIWKENILKKNPQSFSKPRSLATLHSALEKNFVYYGTEFKEYIAVSATSRERTLSDVVYQNMRVAAVGATLELNDGSIFVHRRSYNATHVAGIVDASCAGLCFVKENALLDPESDILKKCERELGLKRDEVQILGVTGIHSSYAPDFSCVVDVALKSNIAPADLEARAKHVDFAEKWYIRKEELPEFVYEHFIEKKDMVGDGAAILLSCLEYSVFKENVERLRKAGKDIQFGQLKNGKFTKCSE